MTRNLEATSLMAIRHLLSIHDLSSAQVADIFELAEDIKANPKKYASAPGWSDPRHDLPEILDPHSGEL